MIVDVIFRIRLDSKFGLSSGQAENFSGNFKVLSFLILLVFQHNGDTFKYSNLISGSQQNALAKHVCTSRSEPYLFFILIM